MKKIFTLFFAILFTIISQAQINNPAAILDELIARKEMYVNIHLKANMDIKTQLEILNKNISIDSYDNETQTAKAYVFLNNFESFQNLNYEYEILTAPSLLLDKSELDGNNERGTNEWDYYPNYDQYLEIMYQFETDYPELCEIVSIGQSIEGREVLFIHINNNLDVEADEPEFMYTSSIHGDELTGYVLMLRLTEYLLSNYESDARITNMVNEIDIWINPLANPDGTFAGGNSSVWGATRSNANGIDMNRNYADPEDGPHPDGNSYQPETLLFMDFAEQRDLIMSANMHGGAEVINYPWDTWSRLAADNDWWYFVSREYADTVHANSTGGYLTGFNDGITNGYDWYSISGGRQDYMNYFHHCREVTMELSDTKLPPASQITSFWDYNHKALLNLMEQSLYGVRGVVTNTFDDSPLEAKVFVDLHDIDESFIFSSSEIGNYNRVLKSGTYDITFSAEGFYDETVTNISVEDYETTIVNVQLEPTVGTIDTNHSEISIYPNPAKDYIKLNIPSNGNNLIRIYDVMGKLIFEQSTADSSLNIPLISFPAGNYVVSVKNNNGGLFNTKLVIE
jgi:hypothetical protein